jgi:Bacteriophytochrome (light-regulated signal transduction histidine kinase)
MMTATQNQNQAERQSNGIEQARVLIVDDEKPQMQALCDTLRDQGYHTTGCDSPVEALNLLKKERFDLLLTDLMMPDMDGISFLQAALQIDPQLIGIVMTGQGTIETAVKAMKSGALDYILKPFKLSAILPVLSRALAVRQLRIQNRALEQCVARRNAELEEANRELESFSWSVSHDLRAPLRAVEGFTKIVLKQYSNDMPQEASRLLGQVERSAEHMGRLIDDLLRLSKLTRQHLSLSQLDMKALVMEVWDELQRAASADRTVEFHVGELPAVLGDYALLRQVFVNLLSNALKFTGKTAAPKISVLCTPGDDELVFCTRDNGAGFDMQYAKKLFAVFQRLHTQDEFEGTGIGLSIVQRIIQRHGGKVWAEGELNKGAAIYFSLPKK